MTNESNIPKENAIVEVETNTEIVEQPSKEEQMRQETANLIEAIRTKAQSEIQHMDEYTKEKYLEAVNNARVEVEKLHLEPEKIEEAVKHLQADAEKNWEGLVKELESFGDRLKEAAQAAWDKLTAQPKP